ncbi:hypothetical protein [Acinetobacter sp. YH12134]|uniref:hypothetical protein n=1 Tax=Acinetobacter sp. YH12134 TaxID=2601118 RepID=UPI0015D2F9A8|nr:hypothetical protein [Acinetobacter sp. YH12134]
MSNLIKPLSLACLLGSALLLSACERNPSPEPKQELSAEDQVLQELKSEPVRTFPKTEQDLHDLQLLTDYEQRFGQMSEEMEVELMQMQQQGTLDDGFARSRQGDNIQSALNMLKELDLKTEQGRYIQGLMYEYWDHQAQLHAQQPASAASESAPDSVKGLGKFIHAQEQLEHWRDQYPQLDQ